MALLFFGSTAENADSRKSPCAGRGRHFLIQTVRRMQSVPLFGHGRAMLSLLWLHGREGFRPPCGPSAPAAPAGLFTDLTAANLLRRPSGSCPSSGHPDGSALYAALFVRCLPAGKEEPATMDGPSPFAVIAVPGCTAFISSPCRPHGSSKETTGNGLSFLFLKNIPGRSEATGQRPSFLPTPRPLRPSRAVASPSAPSSAMSAILDTAAAPAANPIL